MNKNMCLEAIQTIASMPELHDTPIRDRAAVLARLSRAAIGVPEEIDISELNEDQRDSVLIILAGVRDALYVE